MEPRGGIILIPQRISCKIGWWTIFHLSQGGERARKVLNTKHTPQEMKKKPQKQSWTTNKTPKTIQFLEKSTNIHPCKCGSIPNILPVVLSQKKEETNVSANDVLVSQGSGSRRLASATWMNQAVGSDHFTAGLGWIIHRIYGWMVRSEIH